MPGGAYNAGASLRGYFTSPSFQDDRRRGVNSAVDTVIPGMAALRPLMPSAGQFLSGLVGGPTPGAPARQPVAQAQPSGPARYDPLGPAGKPAQLDSSFQGLVERVAKANGGKVSLGQLSALSDIALKTTPKQKQQMPKDIAMQRYMEFADKMLEKSLAEVDEVAKVDPKAAEQLGQNAWMKWQQQYQPLVGADPTQAAIAEAMDRYNQEQ
jgi:hypothetical protein